MFLKLFQVLNTLKYLRATQLWYQIAYRFKKNFISIHSYKKYLWIEIRTIELQLSPILQSKQKEYLGNNSFQFIGITKSFNNQIDWNFQQHGKLWNYNLQYCSYLLDETVDVDERRILLRDFSLQLLSSTIPLEPYPVSIRIVNTLLFHSRHPIADAIVLEALQKQIDYLENNLEYHLLANHLLENLFTLFIASIYLSNTLLYKKSFQLLAAQFDEQILDDGGHYECSVMYHSTLLSKLLLCIEAARTVNWMDNDTISILEENASKMLTWINEYSFPDGSWALINDAAEEIAPSTNDLLKAAQLVNIFPKKTSLSSSGFSKFRGDNWELIIKSGNIQPTYQPGHSHADIGSFCLWYKGKQLIIDRGVSTYHSNSIRLAERSTHVHNTITISGMNQSDLWSAFRVGKRAKVTVLEHKEFFLQLDITPFYDPHTLHSRSFQKLNDHSFILSDNIISKKHSNTFAGSIQFSEDTIIEGNDCTWHTRDIQISFKESENVILEKGVYSTKFNTIKYGSRLFYTLHNSSQIIFELL